MLILTKISSYGIKNSHKTLIVERKNSLERNSNDNNYARDRLLLYIVSHINVWFTNVWYGIKSAISISFFFHFGTTHFHPLVIMKFIAKKILLAIFSLFFIVLPLKEIQTSISAYNVLVFSEDEPGLTTKSGTGQHFSDGSIILQFVRPINSSCNEPTTFIRIVKPDLSVSRINVALPSDANLKICTSFGDKIYMHVLGPPLFLLSYINMTTNPNNQNFTYQRIALLIDFDGVVRK